jgi:hypothetical protein
VWCRWGLDSGLVVVIFITTVYLLLVFGLFFYVKNEWCYVLFKNFTVSFTHRERYYRVTADREN